MVSYRLYRGGCGLSVGPLRAEGIPAHFWVGLHRPQPPGELELRLAPETPQNYPLHVM